MNLPIKHISEVKRLIANCREYTTAFNYCGLISGARADEFSHYSMKWKRQSTNK